MSLPSGHRTGRTSPRVRMRARKVTRISTTAMTNRMMRKNSTQPRKWFSSRFAAQFQWSHLRILIRSRTRTGANGIRISNKVRRPTVPSVTWRFLADRVDLRESGHAQRLRPVALQYNPRCYPFIQPSIAMRQVGCVSQGCFRLTMVAASDARGQLGFAPLDPILDKPMEFGGRRSPVADGRGVRQH